MADHRLLRSRGIAGRLRNTAHATRIHPSSSPGYLERPAPERRRLSAARSGLTALVAGLLIAALLALAPTPLQAAPYGRYNRAQDDWKVKETRHFRFYFTEDTPNTAGLLMQIADETFERLNAGYGWQPADKITVTVVGYTG